jgi:hypothetical protein
MTAVWAVAGATAALHLATARIYSFHRDELYYLASGRRLAWGYVDHPPVVPLLYRVGDEVFGASLLGLRVVPALVHGATVVLTALLARELGGGRAAQVLAALGAAVAPMLLTTGHFLSTVSVEIAVWVAVALVVTRILGGGAPRLWVAVGVLIGGGLLAKWTTLYLVAGLAAGLLSGRDRRVLWSPWAPVGAVVALALWAPNLAWQAAHDWPQLEMGESIRDYGEALLTAPYQLVLLGAVSVLLAIPGLVWLARGPFHALAVAFGVIVVLVTATGGKPYYAGVFGPVLVAAGAVAREGSARRIGVAVVATGVLSAPFAMPLLPVSTADTVRVANREIGEIIGWPELVDAVAAVHRDHPGAAIFTANYAEAGAIELLGPAEGLPQPVSGHNSYWWWGHPPGRSEVTIAVGVARPVLDRMFADVRLAATFRSPAGVSNEEDGAPIWVCTGQRADWADLWPALRHYT